MYNILENDELKIRMESSFDVPEEGLHIWRHRIRYEREGGRGTGDGNPKRLVSTSILTSASTYLKMARLWFNESSSSKA